MAKPMGIPSAPQMKKLASMTMAAAVMSGFPCQRSDCHDLPSSRLRRMAEPTMAPTMKIAKQE
jgi:hypothetical protein